MASMATMPPSTPATFQPIRLTMSTFGPGAACDSAKSCAKSASVIQCFVSTARK